MASILELLKPESYEGKKEVGRGRKLVNTTESFLTALVDLISSISELLY